MIVCVCANVSEHELEETIAAGATTLRDIGRRCGAGVGCGSCRATVRQLLRRHRVEGAAGSASAPATTSGETSPT